MSAPAPSSLSLRSVALTSGAASLALPSLTVAPSEILARSRIATGRVRTPTVPSSLAKILPCLVFIHAIFLGATSTPTRALSPSPSPTGAATLTPSAATTERAGAYASMSTP